MSVDRRGPAWCRRCKCLLHVHPDGTSQRDSDPVDRPRPCVVYVCTVCYHKASLLDGIDLPKPLED